MAGLSYSDWLKVDLHIHTSLSKETKENDYKGTFDVETLKQKMKEYEVDIFSLTDHNIINVEAYKQYYSKCVEDDPLLLLGVELDIEVVNKSNESKTYHSLLIFNVSDIVNVERINKIIENIYSIKGITNKKERLVTIGEIVNNFPEEDFFFIPHAGNTKSIVSPYRDRIQDAQKMLLLMQSAFEKVSEKAQQKYNEGFDLILSEGFKKKEDVAYIEFSDNHNINNYPCAHTGDEPVRHEFYYIKGKKGFETLRLAFIDPKSRIKSSEEYNKLNKVLNVIEGIKIQKNLSMEDSVLTFSPHLNVIVGGRSSGKSLLMFLLGEKIDLIRSEKTEVYKDVVDPSCVEIKCKMDDGYKDKTSIVNDYIYINQGDIVRYFEDKDLGALAKKSSKNVEYEEAIKVFIDHKTKVRSIIEKLNQAYKNAYNLGEKRFVLHDASIQHILSKSYILRLDAKYLLDEHDNKNELEDCHQLITKMSADIETIKKDKHVVFTEADLSVVVNFEGVLQRHAAEISGKVRRATTKRTFIENIEAAIYAVNEAQTAEARSKMEAIAAKRAFINTIEAKFLTMSQLNKAATHVDNIKYSLSRRIVLNEDVDLVLEVLQDSSIKALIVEGLNSGKGELSLYTNLLKLLRKELTIKIHKTNTPTDLAKKIESQLSDVYGEISRPKDYLDYHNGETSKNKSPGYNSERYLEIVLQNSKNEMIFIDQPEDNLGNKFIANKLVEIIRKIKFQKQLFLVTHNPSIVVFGDAECITIAENIDKRIKYRQIVLEDKTAQKEICGILDGGEYVFHNRSRKYNIKRILREVQTNAC